MYKVLPFPHYSTTRTDELDPYTTSTCWQFPVTASSSHQVKKTHIMATLNTTPDSFSDGSDHQGLHAALSYTHESVRNGAHIIDIGGYSTRPGAAFVSEEEEISRVVPVIKAIRSTSSKADELQGKAYQNILISVDTFRPEVARAAIDAGANCINDVYAFAGPRYPLDVANWAHFKTFRNLAAKHRIPVVLMHSRGDAGSHKDYASYAYANHPTKGGAVLEAVKVELGERVNAAVRGRGGLRRWQIIVDPGVGFSKTVEGNLEALRNAARIVEDPLLAPRSRNDPPVTNPLFGFPQLIGASRKSFLGTILEQPDSSSVYTGRSTQAKERGYATAAAVACAVNQGAVVVRVHDVIGMGDVVRMASALWM
jgi:dihydroneopterin aldolase/2-amino-4-hydroxy-6-hydroxymethyldihydropteridine diphosphokinase/dihydropteroate synthase